MHVYVRELLFQYVKEHRHQSRLTFDAANLRHIKKMEKEK